MYDDSHGNENKSEPRSQSATPKALRQYSAINKNEVQPKKDTKDTYITLDVSKHDTSLPLGVKLAPITLHEKSFIIVAGWDHLPR